MLHRIAFTPGPRPGGPARRTPRRKARPGLEPLEAREVLTTYPVAAGDVASLILAIQSAAQDPDDAPDVIQLAANSTYVLTAVDNTFFGPNGLPAITGNVTIEGNGSTIQRDPGPGTPTFRFFAVAGPQIGGIRDGSLTLQDLTLVGGWAQGGSSNFGGGGLGAGGAIFNMGTLSLQNVTIRGGTALGGSSAGALATSPGGNGGGGMGTDAIGHQGGGNFGPNWPNPGGLTIGGAGGSGVQGGGGGGGFALPGGGSHMGNGGDGGGHSGLGGKGVNYGGKLSGGNGGLPGDGGGGAGIFNLRKSIGGAAFGQGGNETGGGGVGGGGGGMGAGGGFGGGGGANGGYGGFGAGGGAGFTLNRRQSGAIFGKLIRKAVKVGTEVLIAEPTPQVMAASTTGGPRAAQARARLASIPRPIPPTAAALVFGNGGFGGGFGSAHAGGGGAGMGGAIFNLYGSVTITDSTLSGNIASGGHVGNPSGARPATSGSGFGGAVFNLNGSVAIAGSNLTGNDADSGGFGGFADGASIYTMTAGRTPEGFPVKATLNLTGSSVSGSSAAGAVTTMQLSGHSVVVQSGNTLVGATATPTVDAAMPRRPIRPRLR